MPDFKSKKGLVFHVANEQEVATVRNVTDEDEYSVEKLPLVAGDVVIDIGANVGAFSVAVAHRFPGVKVIAYEPDPANFELLVRNVFDNGLQHRIETRNIAVWKDAGGVSLTGDGSGVGTIGPGETDRPAESRTLAQVLEPYEEVALVKFDCEGAEVQIITASPDSLHKIHAVVGEYHDAHIKMGYIPPWRMILDAVFEIDWQDDPNPFFVGLRRDV